MAKASSSSIAGAPGLHCLVFTGCQALSTNASSRHTSLCVSGAIIIPGFQAETLRLK